MFSCFRQVSDRGTLTRAVAVLRRQIRRRRRTAASRTRLLRCARRRQGRVASLPPPRSASLRALTAPPRSGGWLLRYGRALYAGARALFVSAVGRKPRYPVLPMVT